MPITRRTYCIYATLVIVTPYGWLFGLLVVHSNQQTRQPPIQSDKYQCRVDTVSSPDNGHIDARNMQRRENKYTKKYVHLVGLICK